MSTVQHATHLNEIAKRRQDADAAQILNWAKLISERIYDMCESKAMEGKTSCTIDADALRKILPGDLPTSKTQSVITKTKTLFAKLDYSFEINFSRYVTTPPSIDGITSVTVTWEDKAK